MKKNKITNFSELLEYKYGKTGTRKRDRFELKSKAFMIAELIKKTRIASLLQSAADYFTESHIANPRTVISEA